MGETNELSNGKLYANDGMVWKEVGRLSEMDISEGSEEFSNLPLGMTFRGDFKFKLPKFWRCKNRKRFKKLMMSLGYSRDLVETYFHLYGWMRKNIKEYNPSYQELWNEILISSLKY